MRLTRSARKWLLTVHIGASVALIGTTSSVVVLALVASSSSAGEAHALYRGVQTLVFAVAIPFSFSSLGSGLLLGLGTHWGVLVHRWVAAKLLLQLAIILTGALVVRPLLDTLLRDSAAGAALGAARWELPLAGVLNLVFAGTAVGLAVFKPGGRLRRGATSFAPRASH